MTGEFREALVNIGFIPPNNIVPGQWTRFPSIGKNGTNKSAACILFEDGNGGYYHDFASDVNGVWQREMDTPFSQDERERFQKSVSEAKAKARTELAERHKMAETQAALKWKSAVPESGEHKYLREKHIQPHGVRTDFNSLIVPIYIDGKLTSLQTILPNGDKRYLHGGRIKGGYFPIGEPNGIILVCEGFATGATLREATGHAVAVALDAGNLVSCACKLRENHPEIDLIICADDDWKTDGNPGIAKAREAARKAKADVVMPFFCADTQRGEKDTDFNDMAMLQGLDYVKKHLGHEHKTEQTDQELQTVSHSNMKKSTINPRGWIVADLILHGHVTAIFAEGGTGKSIFATQLGMAIASGRDTLGLKIKEKVPVLILNNEDDDVEMVRRLVAVREHAGYSEEDAANCHATCGYGNPIKFAHMVNDHVAITKEAHRVKDFITKNGVKVLIIDPFISTHEVEENSNGEMDKVMSVYKQIANDTGCAIVLVHHMRKQGDGSEADARAGNADAGRGASSMKDACRVAMTLTRMGCRIAEQLEINEEDRLNTIRLDIGKGNYASHGSIHGRWMRFMSYPLENSDEHGRTDFVGLLEPMQSPDKEAESSRSDRKWTTTEVIKEIDRYYSQVDQYPGPDAEYAVTYEFLIDAMMLNLGIKKRRCYVLLNMIPVGEENAFRVILEGETFMFWRDDEARGRRIFKCPF